MACWIRTPLLQVENYKNRNGELPKWVAEIRTVVQAVRTRMVATRRQMYVVAVNMVRARIQHVVWTRRAVSNPPQRSHMFTYFAPYRLSQPPHPGRPFLRRTI